MLDKQTLHALDVVAHIACAPAHQSTTTASLSRQLGLSITYVECLMKQLKRGELVQAHRGPGGGYRLQRPVKDMSAGDVARCFSPKAPAAPLGKAGTEPVVPASAERTAVNQLSVQFDAFAQQFLEEYPISDMIGTMPHRPAQASHLGLGLHLHLKELPKKTLPSAPNSVFDLCNFIRSPASYGLSGTKSGRASDARSLAKVTERNKSLNTHARARAT